MSITVPDTGVKPSSVQPGGGFCIGLELAWGRFRRCLLRTFRPGYVRRMAELRQGDCPGCPHDVIDSRDLKFRRNVCGFWFKPEDDRFRWRDRLRLARAGFAEIICFSFLYLLAAVATAVLAAALHWLFWILFAAVGILWFETVYFFRDPERTIPTDPSAVLSPADGTVTQIEEVDEPAFPGGRALRISIFLSVFNVHVNRMPRTCRVVEVRYFPGAFLDARDTECTVRNEQLWIDLEEVACNSLSPRGRGQGEGRPLRVKQISGAIARRIVCWLKPGDVVHAGDRFGMIKFGSRTDLLLPAGEAKEVLVKVGEKVKGGSTILVRV